MKRLFKEKKEFGEYNVYDTDNGILTSISMEEFNRLKTMIAPTDVFIGDSETHTVFPRRIYFQITRRCNLLCPYCFIKANQFEKDLPEDVIMSIIPYLAKNGLMEVRLTGGEPTLLKYFQKVVDNFRNNNVYVSVATNGLWSKEVLEYFCSKPDLWLIISIDGDRETHNKSRENSYDKIKNNLIKLRAKNKNIRVRLNTVLTKDNLNTLESVFSLANQIKAESITFIPLRPQVRDSSIHKLMLNAAEFKSAIEKMIFLKNKYNVNFTTTIETIYKQQIMPDKIFIKKSSCAAGREGTNLDYDYNKNEFIMYGCSYSPACDFEMDEKIRMPFVAGSFPFNKIKHFGDIWQNDECWKLYRNLNYKSSECNDCQYYRTCCTGSCPIQNIDFSMLDLKRDATQQLFEQMQKNSEWYCYKNYM